MGRRTSGEASFEKGEELARIQKLAVTGSLRICSPQCLGGISAEALTISSSSFLKSSKPGAGMIMVSRLPPTSSVMRRNRPRGFSLKVNRNVFRSIWTFSDFSVSSLTGGLGVP